MDSELLDGATRRLYAAPADEFTALRKTLAGEAADAGDGDAARAIAKLRKPTNAARVVNALVADDPEVAVRLHGLGDRLRSAQDDLDAPRLRELTEERRSVVAGCTRRALAGAGGGAAPAGLRDDVLATFDAAVADPDVAARLGTLQRPERFSGFGFAADASTGPPQLTLVQGGRRNDAAAGRASAKQPGKKAAKKVSAAEQRKRKRALDEAQRRFDTAQDGLDAALSDERDAVRAVTKRERELTKAKDALGAARTALDETRATLKEAKTERRAARSALDREQRRTER